MFTELFQTISWEKYFIKIKKYFGINPKSVDDYYKLANGKYINTHWYSINNINEMALDDLSRLKPLEGELLIVSEAVYELDLEPFVVNSSTIKAFVDFHNKNYGYFFEGDLIILSLALRTVWIVHHENVYAVVEHT